MVNLLFHLAPTAPLSVQVAIVAVDEAVVSWDPPHPPNGVVTQYDVRLTDTLSGTPLTVAVPADQGTQSSFDVVQGAEYTVQVRARNGPLVGEYSGPVTFTATFVAMDTSTPQPSPSSAASTSSSSEGVSATPTSSAAVEPSSSEGVSAPPTSNAAPTETAPPTTTGVAPPTPSPPSPSPTIPLTGSTGDLSQQDIIVIAVCCALIALLLLLLVLCAVYVACRKCRDSPDKSLKYKCKGSWANSLQSSTNVKPALKPRAFTCNGLFLYLLSHVPLASIAQCMDTKQSKYHMCVCVCGCVWVCVCVGVCVGVCVRVCDLATPLPLPSPPD